MALHLIKSNRMEVLLTELAAVVASPLDSPFTAETIVVQSRGMQRWLAMELSRRFGVWANCHYPFPNALVDQVLATVLPQGSELGLFSRDLLQWRVMQLMPQLADRPEAAGLSRYLGGADHERRLFQLAGAIADTLDQYTIFRPELLARWEKGAEGGWQALLWRLLNATGAGEHRGRLLTAFRAITPVALAAVPLPVRFSLFGISYLPPYHLEVLSTLAQVREVYFFMLSPCRLYWGDVRRSRALDEEEPNSLVASFGKLGREFGDLLLEVSVPVEEQEAYAEARGESLLAQVQNDILNLAAQGPAARRELPSDRINIAFHSCHSPLREAEVLKDQLLALLAADPQLEPRDILVMTPDIEGYAPAISAVFGVADAGSRLPFTIADRSFHHELQLAETVLALLGLAAGRLTVGPVLDLLEVPAVRRRFGIGEADLATVREWLVQSRVRWGLDADDRQAAGFPAYDEHSWRAGLDRLLLGYAVGEGDDPWHGMLPAAAIGGDQARLLGRFLDFYHRLATTIRLFREAATPVAWAERLRQLAADFLAPQGEEEREYADLVDRFDELAASELQSGFDGTIGLSTVLLWLTRRLEREGGSRGFLSGGITFAALLPMRSIPFKVIALIGMNDGVFPRRDRAPSFDLRAADPRPGDRSLRDEDRYLFLEALLSARHHLHLSYVGQSARDGADLPPAVPVSELLDYLTANFILAGEDQETFAHHLVTRHRLQPFSPEYFTPNGSLFSYDTAIRDAVSTRLRGTEPHPPFMSSPLAGEPCRVISLADLIRCFDNPAKFFLERRLGLALRPPRPPFEEREPFSLDHLQAYSLKNRLTDLLLAGEPPETLLERIAADGQLPPGRHGALLFTDLQRVVADFAATIRGITGPGVPLPALAVQLEIAGVQLSGEVNGIWPTALVRQRPAKLAARDQIRLWIEFLAMAAMEREGDPDRAVLVMRDKSCTLQRPEHPLAQLAAFVAAYQQALMEPLPFYPATSMAFAEGRNYLATWEGSDYLAGEAVGRSVDLCFANADPLGEQFRSLAATLLQPLLQHQETTK